MQIWNVLHVARWKYRTQKIAILAPSHNFVRLYLRRGLEIYTAAYSLEKLRRFMAAAPGSRCCAPCGGGELGPHLTQCCQGQVSSWSIQQFGHNTPTLQTDNGLIAYGEPFYKRSPRKINWVKCGFSSAATSAFYPLKICTSADLHFTPGPAVAIGHHAKTFFYTNVRFANHYL